MTTAKALVEDTKTLVAGAASSQDQLAKAAQNAVTTIVQLSDVVKAGSAALGPEKNDSQVMLLNAVKDVASALQDLMYSTKAASGKSIQDPAMHSLKDSAKVRYDTYVHTRMILAVVENPGMNFINSFNLIPSIGQHANTHCKELSLICHSKIHAE